jgi:uncharacterized membrane-anchored protein YitT (DUF2179 family)
LKKAVSYLIVLGVALVMALNYQLFVFPNSFAPAGLNGIFTMIQHVFGFKLSHTSIILNVPLAILVFFFVSKPFALRTLVYTLAFSGFLMLFDTMDLSAFVYQTTVSALLGPAVAGMITGFCGYYMHRVGACYGGTEFMAKLIHKRKPNVNFFYIIFALNIAVAIASYFVYDYKLEPVLLCILYCYFSSSIRDNMNRKQQSALRCEIVTDRPEEITQRIQSVLNRGVTAMDATGMHSNRQKTVLICILSPAQLPELKKLLKNEPDCFVTVSHVDAVIGNFQTLTKDGNPERLPYDSIHT